MTETETRLQEGQRMPNFQLPDHEELPYDLYETLKAEGPLVLVFNRGDW